MKPAMSLSLLAAVDQSEAWLRDWLAGFPQVEAEVRDSNEWRRAIEMVAIDALAALSEVWQQPVQERLDVLTARLLAWQRIVG